MTAGILDSRAKTFLMGWSDSVRSPDGIRLDQLLSEVRQSYAHTATIGMADEGLRQELCEATETAALANWDGAGAIPYSRTALRFARRLAETFPTWAPSPTVAVDPDGEVGFDWRCDGDNLVAVSVGSDGRISYAGRLNGERRKGSVYFVAEFPEALLDILRRLYPISSESLAA